MRRPIWLGFALTLHPHRTPHAPEYLDEALRRARYELIDDKETPYYGEVADLPGVWACGETLEGCRRELKDVIEGWILVSVKRSLDIPRLGSAEITEIDTRAA